MRTLLILTVLFFSQFCMAQAPAMELLDQDWRIIPGFSNQNKMLEGMGAANPMKQSSGNFNFSKVVISPEEQIVLVNFSKGEFGVMCINQDLKSKWTIPITGMPFAIGKFKGKILVIHSLDVKSRGYSNQFQGTLLEPSNGKKILTKPLFNGTEDFYVEPKFFFVPNEEDFYLGIRQTETEKKGRVLFYGIGYSKLNKEYAASSKFELLSFNDKLEQIKKLSLPVKKSFSFLQSEMNFNKDLFISYYEGENNIGIQKIDIVSGEQKDYKHFGFDLRGNNNFTSDLYLSSKDANINFITLTYKNEEKDRATAVYRINFSDGAIKSATEVFNKSYRKELKEKYQPFDKEANDIHTGEWNEMEIGGLLEFEDKLICFKEVQLTSERINSTDNSVTRTTTTGDGIITIYDKNLKILDQQIIPKSLEYYGMEGVFTSLYIRNNELWMLSGILKRNTSYRPFIVAYDLQNQKITRQIVAEKGNVRKYRAIDPASTLWFQKGFAVMYLQTKGWPVVKSIETDMLRFNY